MDKDFELAHVNTMDFHVLKATYEKMDRWATYMEKKNGSISFAFIHSICQQFNDTHRTTQKQYEAMKNVWIRWSVFKWKPEKDEFKLGFIHNKDFQISSIY